MPVLASFSDSEMISKDKTQLVQIVQNNKLTHLPQNPESQHQPDWHILADDITITGAIETQPIRKISCSSSS